MPEVKVRWEPYKNAACCFKQILETAPYTKTDVHPLTPHLLKHPRKTSITEELRTNLWETFSYRLLHIDTPVLAEKQKFVFHQLCADSWFDLKEMVDRDRWYERVNGIRAADKFFMKMMMMIRLKVSFKQLYRRRKTFLIEPTVFHYHWIKMFASH